jgi:hypothetical protein
VVGGYHADGFNLNGGKTLGSKWRNRDDKDGCQKNPFRDEERAALVAPESLYRPPHSDNLLCWAAGVVVKGYSLACIIYAVKPAGKRRKVKHALPNS